MDAWLIDFLKENFITISLVLSILKVAAMETPGATDDKIIELFTGWMKTNVKPTQS